jgi:hypothetical protein
LFLLAFFFHPTLLPQVLQKWHISAAGLDRHRSGQLGAFFPMRQAGPNGAVIVLLVKKAAAGSRAGRNELPVCRTRGPLSRSDS